MKRKPRLIPFEEVFEETYPTFEAKAEFFKKYQKFEKLNRRLVLKEMGAEVKKARKKSGITQSVLAQRLATNKSNISRIENGRQNISVEYVSRISKALNRPINIEFH